MHGAARDRSLTLFGVVAMVDPPFTPAQFFSVFAEYNAAIWPLQILAYGLGLIAVFALWRNVSRADKVILPVLAILWAVNGVGYHLSFFSEINPLASAFGVAFVLQAVMFAAAVVFPNDLRWKLGRDIRSALGVLCIVYALLIYGVLGWRAGHGLMAGPLFGVAPCPTTIFTIGLLVLARGKWVSWLSIIPMLWSLVGLAAALQLGVPEDLGLPAAGLVLAIFLVVDVCRKRHAAEVRHDDSVNGARDTILMRVASRGRTRGGPPTSLAKPRLDR